MTRFLRIALLPGIALLAGRADAQTPDTPTPEMLREWAVQDSLKANWEAQSLQTASFHVLTVRRQGDGFVYDAEDSTEDTIRIWTDSPIVVRTPGIGRTMVVVDPVGDIPGTRLQNAFVIPPDHSTGLMRTRGSGYTWSWGVTQHPIRVLVCAEDGPGQQCPTWTEARPLSGGPGLTVTILELPERGVGYSPAPYDGTGGTGTGGSGTARPSDDGNL